MSSVALGNAEKIERFYLNSCTDLPLAVANSLHQSFPALNVSVHQGHSSQSRSQNGRKVSESDATLGNNNRLRAKLAFFKICDAITGAKDSTTNEDSLKSATEAAANGSCRLLVNPIMSKEEFVKKLEEGIFRNRDPNGNYLAEVDCSQRNDYKFTQSDYVLAKSQTISWDDEAMTNTQAQNKNNSKSTTAISNDIQPSSSILRTRSHRSSAVSKVMFAGIFLLVFFGIVKNAASKGG